MAAVLDINEAGFASSHVFGKAEIDTLNNAFRTALARHAGLLDRRARAGKIRHCHGDLHLRNICLLEDGPRLFDCIEFNDCLATVDVLYDLSFLLMDLWHRGFREFANLVMNRYLDEADDEDGFVLLPFFMSVRAAVRAHVTATQIEENGGRDNELEREARSYFELARMLLAEQPPRLIAIGGLSGTGKTTIAEALAAFIGSPPGARIIESDRIRKALHGVPPETHLPDSAYRPEMSERVYAEMAWRSDLILAEGGSVVTDAVFDRATNRTRIENVAKERHVPFMGVWLEADPSVLWGRVEGRGGSASDATVNILSRQLQRQVGAVAWNHLPADRPPAEIVADICKIAALEEPVARQPG